MLFWESTAALGVKVPNSLAKDSERHPKPVLKVDASIGPLVSLLRIRCRCKAAVGNHLSVAGQRLVTTFPLQGGGW